MIFLQHTMQRVDMERARAKSVSFLCCVTLLLTAAVVAGCSKPKDQVSATPPAESAATSPSQAPSADPAAQPAPGPILDTSQFTGDPKAAMADADAALRQREYEKAVRTMLAIQQAQLNVQQAEAARQQMIALQRNLANAAANGDPNAIAAGELLRAAHRH